MSAASPMGEVSAAPAASLTALTSLVAGLVALCAYWHWRVFSYWSVRRVPGPRPWPIFGTNIYYLFGNKLKVDARWRARYGKTFGLYEGYSPLLRTTDKELIREVFVRRFSSFTDRNNQFTYEEVQRNWLLWSEGELWANQRALVSPMFSSARMRPWLAVISSCFDRFRGEVDERLASAGRSSSGEKSETAAPAAATAAAHVPVATLDKTELGALLLELIGLSFFGLRVNIYKDHKNEFLLAAREVSDLKLHRLIIWLLLPRFLARLFVYELVPYDCYKYFDLLTKRILEERRREMAQGATPAAAADGNMATSTSTSTPTTRRDFVQFFLEAKLEQPVGGDSDDAQANARVFSRDDDREAHYNDQMGHEQLERAQRAQARAARSKNFTDLQIRGHMTFMFVAGFETTAGSLGFCFYELAHQPRAQQALVAELLEAYGGVEGARVVARAGPPDAHEKRSLDLLVGLRQLDAFISETLRLYAPIIDLQRRVTARTGTTIEAELGAGAHTERRSVFLDAGTPVSVNPFVVQRDPDYFERPDEFVLERFLPENRHIVPSCTFMPFGLGPRYCVGMRFALLAMKLIIARTLLNYEISPGPKTRAYPPADFGQNTIFLVPNATDFRLAPRQLE